MSGDSAMCDAFRRGQDIHTRTAAEIHGVPMDQVTPEMRRSAKAVNFGIVYGISGFGLARNAHITRREADGFIRTYFERYPGVRAFMDACVEKGRALGYAETLFGRRRELFELASPNRNVRSFGERAAMNTPVQGTAADIIKLAMVQVARRLEEGGYRARLILQVHDEPGGGMPPRRGGRSQRPGAKHHGECGQPQGAAAGRGIARQRLGKGALIPEGVLFRIQA